MEETAVEDSVHDIMLGCEFNVSQHIESEWSGRGFVLIMFEGDDVLIPSILWDGRGLNDSRQKEQDRTPGDEEVAHVEAVVKVWFD